MGQYYNVYLERANGWRNAFDRTVDGEYTMAKLTELLIIRKMSKYEKRLILS